MKVDEFTPEQRADAIRYYFGWPGATIHQLAAATGLASQDILYREHGSGSLGDGFSAVRTCDRQWRAETLAPKHQGDWIYWRSVIIGYWITGPLTSAA